MKQKYLAIIESSISGIPCKIGVTTYFKKEADPYTWDSDFDYYGYIDCEYDILDRKGYAAHWLEKKLCLADREIIEMKIKDHFKELENYCDENSYRKNQ